MKAIEDIRALTRFSRIFFWLLVLFISNPTWAVSFCAEYEPYPANEPAQVISNEDAVNIAGEYLDIESTENYKTKIEEKVITANAFNTYKILDPGMNRMCWIVTLIVPDAPGASRTVYIDKTSGEILGGYASK